MSRVKSLLRSFAAGEVSPLLHGRVDLVPYQTGLSLCENFVTLPQGPAKFRPGFRFAQYGVADTARLIPFVYSDDQAYFVEFSEAGYLRIHTVDGTLLDDTGDIAITSISNDNPGLIGLPAGDAADGDDVYLDVTGMPEVDGRWYRLDFVSTDTVTDLFKLTTPTLPAGVDTTDYGIFSAGTASIPLMISHPYAAADLPLLRYAQSADVLTVVSGEDPVYVLERTGPNTWAFTVDSFGPECAAPTSLTATPGGGAAGTPSTHYYVVTAVVTDGSANAESLAYGPANASQDLTVAGQYIDLNSGSPAAGTRHNYYKALNGLYGFIGQGGGTFRDNNITPDLSISPPEYGEDFNAAGDYPRTVSYHQQRKAFAGTVNKPQTIWMTRTGTEVDMTYTVPSRDDNALAFGIASREVQTIQHLVPLRDLLVLTSGGLWKVVAQNSDTLTPSSVSAELASYAGASYVQPTVAESAVLYAFARGGRVGEIRYSDAAADYAVSDVCLLAPHLFDGYSIVDMALMETPTRILWVLRSDGTLLSMTYQPEHKVLAWHRHDVGGAVRSICVIPNVTDAALSEDVLVAYVDRRNGATEYQTIELLSGFGDYPVEHKADYWDAEDSNLAQSQAIHVDSALVYEGAPADVIIGLHHLEGREVSIVADGAVHPPLTVANGQITLEAESERVVIGLPYTGRLTTLPLSVEGAEADGQGVTKSVSRAYLRFWQSSGVFVGPDFQNMDELKARTDEAYGVAPAWKTGEYEIVISPLWSREGSICVEQRDPMPLVLLSMTLDVEIGG